LCFGPVMSSSSASVRLDPRRSTPIRAPRTASAGRVSPAGEHVPRLPRSSRHCGSGGADRARSLCEQWDEVAEVSGEHLGVGEPGTEDDLAAVAPPALQLGHAAERDDGRWTAGAGVHLDHEVGPPGEQLSLGHAGERIERLLQRPRQEDSHDA